MQPELQKLSKKERLPDPEESRIFSIEELTSHGIDLKQPDALAKLPSAMKAGFPEEDIRSTDELCLSVRLSPTLGEKTMALLMDLVQRGDAVYVDEDGEQWRVPTGTEKKRSKRKRSSSRKK